MQTAYCNTMECPQDLVCTAQVHLRMETAGVVIPAFVVWITDCSLVKAAYVIIRAVFCVQAERRGHVALFLILRTFSDNYIQLTSLSEYF